MPNGYEKNWMRLCAAINGFRARHSRWPSRVRLAQPALRQLANDLFTPKDFEKITEKVALVRDDEAEFIAEDDKGRTFNYGQENLSGEPDIQASRWLGVSPKPEHLWIEHGAGELTNSVTSTEEALWANS